MYKCILCGKPHADKVPVKIDWRDVTMLLPICDPCIARPYFPPLLSPQFKLTDIEGSSRLSGTADNGTKWIQFEVDYLAEQTDGECVICHAILSSGWMCLDGGEEVCSEHILLV
jgi:hypothetical protein